MSNYNEILTQIGKKLPQAQVYVMRYYPINTLDFGQDSDEKTLFETRSNEKFQKASDKIEKLAQKHHFHFIQRAINLS